MRTYGLILFALFVLVMSWEDQRSAAALYTAQPIPEESIRLRIIANSDSPGDQSLKRKVRDEINAYLTEKVIGSGSIEEARQKIKAELPQLQQLVHETVIADGFEYTSKVDLAKVPFPTKMYGQYVYPAGEYEALRVTIGAGEGQNWWCVLFPPLCFVDISTGDAVKADQADNRAEKSSKNSDQTVEWAAGEGETGQPAIEVRFIFVEWLWKLFSILFG